MSATPARPGLRPGRRPGFSLDDIAEAALAVGFRNLTMSSVADRLGVKHSSLYRRVPSRDDLVIAAMDLAVQRADWPVPGKDWRAYLEETAHVIWGLLAAHPGMAGLIHDLPRTPPSVTRIFYATAHELTGMGFTPRDAVLVVDTLTDLATDVYTGWERLVRERDTASGERTTGIDQMRESWSGEHAAPEAAPFAAVLGAVIDGDPYDWFRSKLALFLDGAATRLPRSGPGED
ncbi:TetR/AcrR family transcriptional regulator [Streptosporangium sp. NPDC051023]|uniref:TetR/AcrR family transcriptional regulator n=1 Tax=Streptosporangium sp. NPDC051023 TaxID=3155410 RepID=UPI00344EAEB6